VPAPKASVLKTPLRAIPTMSASAPKPVPKLRTFRIASTDPPSGVWYAVDKDSPKEAVKDLTFEVPEGPHSISFTCVNDMCVPQTMPLPAEDSSLSPAMKIKDARITVDGPAAGIYGLTQRPDVVLHAGVPTPVPMRGGSEPFTVVERNSGKTHTVSARAGSEVHVDFGDLQP